MTGAQMELLDAADQICRRWPASVTSWWRSPRHNASLPGSVPNSQHQQGLAVDIKFDGPEPTKAELAPYLSRTMQDVRSEPGHVHLEQDPSLLRRVAGGTPVSVISAPSPSPATRKADPSLSTYSRPSAPVASTGARVAIALYHGRTAGPGSSPLDELFRKDRG